MRHTRRSLSCVLACMGATASSALAGETFELVILHNNDGESQLINAGTGLEEFGGVARFATVVDNARNEAGQDGQTTLMLSSGDNFLAGPEFNASLENGVPFFDAVALGLVGYDAMCIGNHEFDFGPQTLADFINSFQNPTPFLSANLDFSGEPSLQSLVEAGSVQPSTIVQAGGEQIGIVGATTSNLPFISSPGNVVVDDDVVANVQAEVDALSDAGVDKIILISHLQSVQEDIDLIGQLSGVDVVIAGGGDELLADPDALLVPDDAVDEDPADGVPDAIFGPYPLSATDQDGNTVYVVTTKGQYRYVGRLIVTFDGNGNVIDVDEQSGPIRVAGGDQPDAVEPDPKIQKQVVDPVTQALEELAKNEIAQSEVPLNGIREDVRSRETNLGNLITDALAWQAETVGVPDGLPAPDIALQNGGGIRNDSIIPAGPISELETFNILPFANFVTVFPAVPADEVLAVFENAVSRIDPPAGFPTDGTGRFAQISGAQLVYDVSRDPGQRVLEVTLDDGTKIIEAGQPAPDAPDVTIATIDFLANGGDAYPFSSEFEVIGVSYQQALANYLEGPLAGLVTSRQYPEGGEGRIAKIDPDFNDDSFVTVDDLLVLLSHWGPCPDPCQGEPCPGDITGPENLPDGVVDTIDLLQLLTSWG